ncbi:hypothetical protein ACTL6U_03690 [Rhodovibrionaceae bacterium A322]
MQKSRDLVLNYRACWEAVIRGKVPLSDLDGFFNLPCFMVSLTGEVSLYASQTDITDFNQSRLAAFREGGAHNALLRGLDFTSQGPCLTLATVNWELTRKDGSVERAWRHYYTIREGDTAAAPAILVSAFQTGS